MVMFILWLAKVVYYKFFRSADLGALAPKSALQRVTLFNEFFSKTQESSSIFLTKTLSVVSSGLYLVKTERREI